MCIEHVHFVQCYAIILQQFVCLAVCFFFSTVCDNCTRNVWNVHFGLDPMNNGHAPAIYDMRYFHIFVEYSMDVNVYSLPFSHTYIFIHRHKFYAA